MMKTLVMNACLVASMLVYSAKNVKHLDVVSVTISGISTPKGDGIKYR